MVKMTMEEEKSEEKPIKKEKKHKKGQANDGSLAVVKKEPKRGKMADAVVSVEKGEQKKKKKKKTDSLNAANGSEVPDGKGVNKKKKKTLLADIETHVETAQSLVKEEEVEKKQKKIKAKNKSTQIKQENIVKEEEEEQQVGKDNLPKKVKKGKKHILDMSTEVTKEQMKEKKKKKLLADYETQLETAQSLVKEDVEKKWKKKVKNKSAQIKRENIIKNEEDEQQLGKKSPQKKVKGKKHIFDVSTEVTEEPMKEKKKKQKCPLTVDEGTVTAKKKAKVAENGIKLETPEYENGDVKIKKKETKTKEDGNGEETTEIKGKKSKAVSDKVVKSEKQEKSTNPDFVHMDEGKTELKKKAKKDKCKITTMEAAKTEEEEPKKKKRKKVNHEEKPLLDKSEEVQEDEQRRESLCKADETPKKKSKKKKSSAQVEHMSEGGDEPVAKKKKKIKQEQENPAEIPQVDVVFLSERSGNTDEITINQERRQALQMEVDKASQPLTVKPTGFGQWSTASFNSSEQQQKFLRLMGGFKKGFQPAVTSTGGANMALGKDAQQQLQQNLLGEFERAQSRRMDLNNRGAGLGFTAPSNKKFSIDINACRSVRFDD